MLLSSSSLAPVAWPLAATAHIACISASVYCSTSLSESSAPTPLVSELFCSGVSTGASFGSPRASSTGGALISPRASSTGGALISSRASSTGGSLLSSRAPDSACFAAMAALTRSINGSSSPSFRAGGAPFSGACFDRRIARLSLSLTCSGSRVREGVPCPGLSGTACTIAGVGCIGEATSGPSCALAGAGCFSVATAFFLFPGDLFWFIFPCSHVLACSGSICSGISMTVSSSSDAGLSASFSGSTASSCAWSLVCVFSIACCCATSACTRISTSSSGETPPVLLAAPALSSGALSLTRARFSATLSCRAISTPVQITSSSSIVMYTTLVSGSDSGSSLYVRLDMAG